LIWNFIIASENNTDRYAPRKDLYDRLDGDPMNVCCVVSKDESRFEGYYRDKIRNSLRQASHEHVT